MDVTGAADIGGDIAEGERHGGGVGVLRGAERRRWGGVGRRGCRRTGIAGARCAGPGAAVRRGGRPPRTGVRQQVLRTYPLLPGAVTSTSRMTMLSRLPNFEHALSRPDLVYSMTTTWSS